MREGLFLSPDGMALEETYGLLENQRTLRRKVMKSLLDACSSVKVKRRFMFMAERAGAGTRFGRRAPPQANGVAGTGR